jgi:CMP-N-acetylneuraminic acid synthetase
MKTVALIPARSGSKRIKDKNIKLLAGIPLLAHSVLTAKQANLEVFVSTDSASYAAIAREWGAQTVYRPERFCTDTSTDFDVLSHFIQEVKCDLIVYLRPTTPFRSTPVVMGAVKLMQFPGYDSLRSVELMSESAYKCFRIKFGLLRPLTKKDLTDRPNQAVPATYHPNGYVDIVRASNCSLGPIWGLGRYAYQTKRVPELDTEDDWEYAEWYAQKRRKWSIGKADNSVW